MNKDIREIFADRLRELREEKGLSYKQLELKTGISRSALCRIENGKVDAKLYQIASLARFFGVSSDYLMGLEN